MSEIWADIKDYEGLYQVSNQGRVKSLSNGKNRKEKILKPHDNGTKHLSVALSKNNKKTIFKVHRLVATAFIPNPNNFPVINHKDNNPFNNCDENLEWCTQKYNIRFSKSKKVGQFKNDQLIRIFFAIRDVENYGFHRSAVSACCKGKKNHHHGFQWKYID